MTIYLSGRITGDEGYYSKFEDYERFLIDRYGCEVINPAKVSLGLPSDWTHEQYMRHLLPLIDEADAVFFIKDWMQSLGAAQEMGYTISKGKEIIHDDTRG